MLYQGLEKCSLELGDLKELIPSLNKRLELRKTETESLKQNLSGNIDTIQQLEQLLSTAQREAAQATVRCKRLEVSNCSNTFENRKQLT